MKPLLPALAVCVLLAPLSAAQAQTSAKILKIVAPWEIGGLDPARSGYIFSRMGVVETLVSADAEGRPVPALAERWEVAADGLTWRFALRPGVVFHDGTPVTAEALVASLEKARKAPALLASVPIARIAAEPGAVVIQTERPFRSLLAFLAHYSSMILAPAAYGADGGVTAMIGSGPYRVVAINAPLTLETARFERWWGPKPAIESVSYQSAGRGETRAALAESGQADIVYVLAPETVDRLKRLPKLNVSVQPIPRVRTLKLNAGSPYFSDPRVRQAVSLAIDREGIAAAILRSPASTATQLFPPSLGDWYQKDLPPLGFDPAKAAVLLDAAGWRVGADGTRVKDGLPFKVALRTFSDRPELPPVATALQAQLKAVGLDVAVSITNSGEIPAGHRDGTLQMGLAARNFSLVPDPLGTLLQDFGPEGGDWGAMGWKNDRLIAALGQLSAEADAAARAQLRREIAGILHTELPVIPVAWYDYAVAANKRVKGVVIDPLELSYNIERMAWAE
ncbi:ABC transporter substrate-binding protein [Elstera litoralis]|uniref:ABC transporter substrate-binding protein n=1 Tax=Elstera litoralis TaxID=552518 RepID=A0A0F3IU40_9PROT|nr:ABC transporter substrate-binding protein [Elstera litoralis]KJV10226.1 ABC transporter substrate-binding protein [Elstera litoralis]